MKRLTVLLLFFLVLNIAQATNSEKDSTISISGQIIHSKTLAFVPLATISIKRTRKGIICDSLGIFHLQIQQSDTLRISALGYKPIDWEVPFVFNPDSPPFFQIKLEDISYLLGEVDIYALGTWEDFKDDFIHSHLPEEEHPEANFKISEAKMQNIKDEIAINTAPNIIGGLVFYASKLIVKKKKKRKIFSKEIQELHKQILAEKYNNEIIKQLTNEEGDELEKLREFINTNTNFTYETNEITIQTKIVELYKKYKLSKDSTKP